MRQINAAGLALIKEFEQGPDGGPALKAYRCPAGVWTIGWGHTGPDVHEGSTITLDGAETLLDRDLDQAEADVAAAVVAETNENAYAAMVSLRFNIGRSGFLGSTVLKRHNAGDWPGAARAFALWNKGRNSEGKLVVLNGLTRRRAAEAALYMTPTAMSEEHDPQRTRAVDVVPSADPVATVTKIGGGVVAVGTVAQQAVAQAADVREGLERFGLDPHIAMAILAVAVVASIWLMMRRREG